MDLEDQISDHVRTIEVRYDRDTSLWIVQKLSIDGDQIDGIDYAATKREALMIAKHEQAFAWQNGAWSCDIRAFTINGTVDKLAQV